MSYARLGQTCQTDFSTLLDAKKFFKLNEPVYDIFFTKMYRYPSVSTELPPVSDIERPEDIKISKEIRRPEEFKYNCCGSK